jgi:hypothetical protein
MTDNLYKDICKNGTYYNPASSHYAMIESGCNSVVCDRCKKDSLNVCIGKDDSDLCLKCVQDITNFIQTISRPNMGRTRMEQSMFCNMGRTRMEQSMFSDTDLPMTKMEQGIYLPLRPNGLTRMEQGIYDQIKTNKPSSVYDSDMNLTRMEQSIYRTKR